MADALTSKRCVPCEGGIPALTAEEIAYLNEATEAFRTYSPLRETVNRLAGR